MASSSFVQTTIGVMAAEYLRLVWMTNRFHLEPPDIYESIAHDLPVIIAMWHGQHLLMPFIKHKNHAHRAKVLVSRHRDGAINAIAARRLGVDAIRGSGTQSQDYLKKGGITAFSEMVKALEDGYSVALTADVPKVARVCGLGIVKLASVTGRVIYPMAIATSRRMETNTWDRTTINLPFGHGGRVTGAPIRVPRDASDTDLEAARRAVEEGLNAVTQRAYHLADQGAGKAARG
jgi:lysophospholipid acyltransferase (LPLAT)-like uncharacterized protein